MFRKAETELLADYNDLFGPGFASCRKNIRPHLPASWVGSLSLTEDPSDVKDAAEDSNGNALPKITPEEAVRLRKRLHTKASPHALGLPKTSC